MKLESLLIALLLCICTVKTYGKVSGDLLATIEEGGSGTDNETLINSIEKINGGSKKQIDSDTESSGDMDDIDDPDYENSGSGSGSGRGTDDEDGEITTPASPTFKISTGSQNMTSSIVVINTGSTGATATTERASTVEKSIKEVTKSSTTSSEIDNNVESTPSTSGMDDGSNVISDKSRGLGDSENDSNAIASGGVNFTLAIIIGVVVGAILSILIIVFLVYRLRKKDEGSYSLDEPSSAMLTADTDSPPPKGKGEYFA